MGWICSYAIKIVAIVNVPWSIHFTVFTTIWFFHPSGDEYHIFWRNVQVASSRFLNSSYFGYSQKLMFVLEITHQLTVINVFVAYNSEVIMVIRVQWVLVILRGNQNLLARQLAPSVTFSKMIRITDKVQVQDRNVCPERNPECKDLLKCPMNQYSLERALKCMLYWWFSFSLGQCV